MSLDMPGQTSVLHVNMLRPWKNTTAHVSIIVVADEYIQYDKDSLPPTFYRTDLTSEQVKVMDDVLTELKDIVLTTPEKCS